MNAIARLRQRYSDVSVPLLGERRLELVLLVLAALLLLQLLWFALGMLRDPGVKPVPPAADSLRAATTLPAEIPTPEQSLAVRARPLFWASRRPGAADGLSTPTAVAQDGEASGTPAKVLQSLLITGIYGAGSEGGVIVRYKGKRQRIATGQELDGWQLDSVTPASAVFVSAGVRDERQLVQRPVAGAGADDGATAEAQARAMAVQARLEAQGGQQQKEPRLSLGG